MKDKTIIVEIDEHGNSSIDLAGFEGKGCGEVARTIQGADSVTRSEKKREFHIETTGKQATELRRK
jgi:hypothetical protein